MSRKRSIFGLLALEKHVEEVVAIAEVKYFITNSHTHNCTKLDTENKHHSAIETLLAMFQRSINFP